MQAVIDRFGIRTCLIAVVASGMTVRVLAALLSNGHWFDLDLLGDWGRALNEQRIDEFYVFAKNPDHLPGDLWFHWILSNVFHLLGGSHYWGTTYYFLLRMLPSVADIAIACSLFSIVRNLVSPWAGLVAAALFFLNPAILFVSSVWGQWDSVSMALLLAGLAVVVSRPERWLLAIPLIAWATVVKPPLALPGMFIIALPMLLTLRDSPSIEAALRRIVPSIVACGALGLATIIAISAPFNVGLPGMATRWTIIERAQIALDMYPYKVLGAGNFWMLQQGSFAHIHDRSNVLAGLDAHDLGNVYLVLSFVVTAAVFSYLVYGPLRDRPFVALTWATVAINFATYMVPTRVHERYLFPTLALMIMLLGITRIGRTELAVVGVVSGTFLANLSFVYFGFNEGFRVDYGDSAFAFLLRTTAVLNIACFFAVILMPLRWIRRPFLRRDRQQSVTHVNDVGAQ